MVQIHNPRLAARLRSVTFAPPEPEKPSHLERFIEHLVTKRYAKKTVRNYRLDLRKMAREIGTTLELVSKEQIEAYMAQLSRSTLTAATIQRKQASLRGFYRWALKQGIVQADPTVDLETPKKPARLPIHLEDPEVEALMGALRSRSRIDLREAAMIKTLYYTGCRAGELVGLDVTSWDRRAGYLRVVGKGDKERRIPVPQALAEALSAWLAVHPTGTGAMFTSLGADPGRLTYDRVRGMFHQVVRRAGLDGKGFTPHKLRHTYATRLLHNGVPIDQIQRLLGHAQISTTTLYAHTRIGDDTVKALDRIL